jgi:hypothetical protein
MLTFSHGRRLIMGGLGAALLPGAAWASAIDINQTTARPTPDETPEQVAAAKDPSLRMTVPVRLNDAGPYNFVVDTGANRSVVSSEAAAALGLPDAGPSPVHGIAGVEMADTVSVSTLTVGAINARDLRLPLLQGDRMGAQGLLGIDVLRDREVTLDFLHGTLEIGRPQGDLSSRGDDAVRRMIVPGSATTVSVPAQYESGQLIIVDAAVSGIGVHAFLDSGSEDTVGNLALREQALMAMPDFNARLSPVELLSATGQIAQGDLCVMPAMRLASMTINQLPVVFSDLHTFELWGLHNRPALLIGMDVLRRFDSIDLDFGHRVVRFHFGEKAA